jgi:hypothetical protein
MFGSRCRQDWSQLFLQNGKVVDCGDAGNVIEIHEHKGDFVEPLRVKQKAATR